MTKATIAASEKRITDIFCDKYLFSIPPYQRPYAWTREEAGELLDDLQTALQAGTADKQPPYFLGSVVLIKKQDESRAEVVDGQQRLTTLTMLLSVLRDLVDEKIKKDTHKLICQEGDSILDIKDQHRLTPREKDATFFSQHIQAMDSTKTLPNTNGLSESQQRFVENARYFHDRLKTDDVAVLHNLIKFIGRHCYLVIVEVSDTQSAYRVFSVMNTRGLNLTATDILKANIIGSLPDGERDEYTEIWEDKEERLGRDKFTNLFSHIRMIHRRRKMQTTLDTEIIEYIYPKPTEDPKLFLNETVFPFADTYSSIIDNEVSGLNADDAQTVKRNLSSLARLDNFDWQAPAILFVHRHEDRPDTIARFIADLERLAYGLFIRRAYANERIARYGNLLQAIDDRAPLHEDGSPLQLEKREQREILERLDGPLYLTGRVCKPVLLRLDEALSDGSASYDHGIVSIEHVLPQSPEENSEWLAWFPDRNEREEWVHRVANLTLLSRSKNTRAGNFKFNRKKKEYFTVEGTTPFPLTSWILGRDTWDKSVLEERQKQLLEKFAAIWRLET